MESSRGSWAGIGRGLGAYVRSFRTIRDMGARRAYAVAALLTAAFVLAGAWAIGWAVDAVTEVYRTGLGVEADWPEDAGWWERARWVLASAGEVAVQVVTYVALFWVKVKLTKYVVLVFLGPLMAWVSERAEAHLSGEAREVGFRLMLREFIRGVRSAALLFAVEMGLGAAMFGLSMVLALLASPVAALMAPLFAIASFLMGAWFYGASTFDFIWERRGMGARAGLRASWGMRGRVLGVGLPFQVWMMVPVLSWFVAPIIAPVTCAVAAVLVLPKSQLTEQAGAAPLPVRPR